MEIHFVTPSNDPGLTVRVGKLVFICNRTGFDFAWGTNWPFWTVNF